jgi:hypothetical protein
MPAVDPEIIPGSFRHDVIASLIGSENIGIELGVAAGIFSERMVSSGKFSHFFGVDMYADIHDTNQYKEALSRVGILSSYKLLRMTFDESIDLFEDDFFDFIYVDGYAHTGEEGGDTLLKWYKKLKVGGVMAGDDYHPDWPLVQWAVNDFVSRIGVPLRVTENSEELPYCAYPSWFFIKREYSIINEEPNRELIALSRSEKDRIAKIRNNGSRVTFRRAVISFLDSLGLKQALKKLVRR